MFKALICNISYFQIYRHNTDKALRGLALRESLLSKIVIQFIKMVKSLLKLNIQAVYILKQFKNQKTTTYNGYDKIMREKAGVFQHKNALPLFIDTHQVMHIYPSTEAISRS